ncbi:MAG: small multi-drug export protein [Methanobacteriota archaeon]
MPDWRYVAKRLGLFFLPVAIVALYCIALYEFLEWEAFMLAGALMVLYFITPIGKYLLIPGALLVGLNTVASWIGWSVDMPGLREMHGETSPFLDIALVAFSVAFIDITCSMFLVNNFDLLQMIPVIGKWLRKLEEKGAARLRKRREGEKLAFMGLTGFVSLSVQGSGGIMSTLIGRMAGIRGRVVFAAVTAGSLIGCFAIAGASYYAGGAILDSYGRTVVETIGYCILASVIVYLICDYWRDRKKKPV